MPLASAVDQRALQQLAQVANQPIILRSGEAQRTRVAARTSLDGWITGQLHENVGEQGSGLRVAAARDLRTFGARGAVRPEESVTHCTGGSVVATDTVRRVHLYRAHDFAVRDRLEATRWCLPRRSGRDRGIVEAPMDVAHASG